MSNYKKKWYTPEQCMYKVQWEEAVRHETEVAKTHPVNKAAEEFLNSPVAYNHFTSMKDTILN